jgi:hypothetical protein
MRKLLALTIVALLALAAAGCGSSDGSEPSGDGATTTEPTSTTAADDDTSTTAADGDVEATDVTAEEYEAAFVTSLTTGDRDGGDLVLPDDAAECVAPRFVEAFTVEQLNEAGVSEEDASDPGFDPSTVGIDEEQAQAMVDAFGPCDFDIYAELAASLTAGLGSDVEACAEENLDEDLADALLVTSFSTGQSDDEFEALLADLQESCDLPDM